MKRVSSNLPCLGGVVLLLAGAGCAQLPQTGGEPWRSRMPEATDTIDLWWADGTPAYYHYPEGTPGDNAPPADPAKKEILCMRAGGFGLAVDTVQLNRLWLGDLATVAARNEGGGNDRANVGKQTGSHDRSTLAFVVPPSGGDWGRAAHALPQHELALTFDVGGVTYRCDGRWPEPAERPAQKAAGGYSVRFVEYGRYFQRVLIANLRFRPEAGDVSELAARLEIAAWSDRVTLALYVEEKGGVTAESLRPSLQVDGQTSVLLPIQTNDNQVREAGCLLRLFPVAESAGSGTSEVTARSLNNDIVPEVRHSEALGCDQLIMRGPKWSNAKDTYYPEEHLDRFDQWEVTLANPGEKTRNFRLQFDNAPMPITGFTPMLLDADGEPVGIPVQISKNWHADGSAHYRGTWYHGYARVLVQPRSTVTLRYALAYARWGGVPAASHAQLSLIGWGTNQFWDECAVGSFGETICYEPGRAQRRSFITDVRPLMVVNDAAKDKPWGWTGNVGGGDFLVYFDAAGRYVPMLHCGARYDAPGPNLTDVTYHKRSYDDAIQANYRLRLARVDDYVRIFHSVRYDVRRPLPFSRLAFCQMPADYYNDLRYSAIALGDRNGMRREWDVGQGSWRYEEQGVPMTGIAPWVSLHDVKPDPKTAKPCPASRGLIVRKWAAVLGGQKSPLPHLAIFQSEWWPGNFRTLVELGPPPGLAALSVGDWVEMELELVLLPAQAKLYYGTNTAFATALARDANHWRLVQREAAGNDLAVTVHAGELRERYPLEIRVDSRCQTAAFTVQGGIGLVPVRFSGLAHYRDYVLLRDQGGKATPFTQGGRDREFWQTDFDPASRTWSRVYNLPLGDESETLWRFQRSAAPEI